MLELLLGIPKKVTAPVDGTTSLLMHFDNNYNDEGGNQVTVTAGPSMPGQLSKFGNNAVLFNGTGRLTIPDAPALRLTAADWTIEGWIRVTAANFNQNTSLMGKGSAFIQYWNGYLYLKDDAGSYRADGSIGAADTWHHFAFTGGSSPQELFIDGVKKKSVAVSSKFGDTSSSLIIGSSDGYNAPFLGYLDELRISQGRLYTENFTPPTGPFSL